MKKILFVLTRLWRYQNLYFLKPNDAINDTLTASLLIHFDWSGSVVEIGSGDGVFSYVMHGGRFPLSFDRYLQTDFTRSDIYDTHEEKVINTLVSLSHPNIILAIDAKETHIKKNQEIKFAKKCQVAAYEELPLLSNSIEKIFYYIPHGLKNHSDAISEANRILVLNGKMLILVYDENIKSSFLCYRLSKKLWKPFSKYFSRIDGGRFEEISAISKTPEEWDEFFQLYGFKVEKNFSGLSNFAWAVYDIQTRPILKQLILFFNYFPPGLRTLLKFLWMIIFYPYLVIFYALFSNEIIRINKNNCYHAYELTKIY